ncbi:uncharacterized protein LOC131023008 [Salvia miltiorrhiza]|uniref:uncharacterized protein LOC131023008 n=1 Tax=Salvia miltiorrhiza TaxID=226208 RepID=UPI0025AC3BA8|nr:uncharacterized protein LOC131023008 [Salvia miltiorrhiza]
MEPRQREKEWREVRKRGIDPKHVQRKPARSWNRNTLNGRRDWSSNEREGTTTFFFNNIPEDCSLDFLRRKFETVAKTVDVYCPRKRDLRGRPFGFVRFQKVERSETLLEDLNKLWIGSYKVRVYKPKFERDVEKRRNEQNSVKEKKLKQIQPCTMKVYNRHAGVSFKEALTGAKDDKELDDETFQFQTTEEDLVWLNGAFTGYIKSEFLWEEVQEEINSECAGCFKLKSLGGNMVLIQSSNEQTTEENLNKLNEWRDFWLQWWRPWKSVDINYQRVVWTKWTGVPIHVWNSRFFSTASARFGLLLKIEEKTRTKERLDVAFIQMSTGFNSIGNILKCKIDGASFQIRVEEMPDNFVSPEEEERSLDEDVDSECSLQDISQSSAKASIVESETEDGEGNESVTQKNGVTELETKVVETNGPFPHYSGKDKGSQVQMVFSKGTDKSSSNEPETRGREINEGSRNEKEKEFQNELEGEECDPSRVPDSLTAGVVSKKGTANRRGRGSRKKTQKSKATENQHQVWGNFIADIESEGEMGKNGSGSRSTEADWENSERDEDTRTWLFAKKLGLSSNHQDAVMIEQLKEQRAKAGHPKVVGDIETGF